VPAVDRSRGARQCLLGVGADYCTGGGFCFVGAIHLPRLRLGGLFHLATLGVFGRRRGTSRWSFVFSLVFVGVRGWVALFLMGTHTWQSAVGWQLGRNARWTVQSEWTAYDIIVEGPLVTFRGSNSEYVWKKKE